MEKIKVSVIIPVYNMEERIAACLNSVLSQTLKEIEIICVNDGSTDKTPSILEQYREEHANIVIINQKNQGAGVARNNAIDIAKGEFVIFLDADDYYPEEDVLEVLYTCAVREKVLICGGSMVREKEGITYVMENGLECFAEDGVIFFKEYQYMYGYQRFLFNKEFLKENKIYFPPYRRFQDPPFMVKAMIKAEKFYAIRKCVYVLSAFDKVVRYEQREILNGIAKGIHDILIMSSEAELERLHTEIVTETLKRCINYFYKSIYKGNSELESILYSIGNDIDESLLKKEGKNIEKTFLLNRKEIEQLMRSMQKKEMNLWEIINKYAYIVIYGAGVVGKTLYGFIMSKGYRGKIGFGVSAQDTSGTACGNAIRYIGEYVNQKDNALVLIAVNGQSKKIMRENAEALGFKNVLEVEYDELKLF